LPGAGRYELSFGNCHAIIDVLRRRGVSSSKLPSETNETLILR
jgi:hypothetical protein